MSDIRAKILALRNMIEERGASEAEAILTWDLIVIPMMMGMATLLILAGLVGIRTHRAGKDRPPEGTILSLMILAIMAAMTTLLILVAVKIDLIVADLKATMVSETEIRTLLEAPGRTTMPKMTPADGLIRRTGRMLAGDVTSD